MSPTAISSLVSLALVVSIAGCGGDAETGDPTDTGRAPVGAETEGEEPAGTQTEAPAPGEVEAAPTEGPIGPLGTSSVGPVRLGMDMKEVEELFGKPDDKEEVSFGGPGVPAPQVDWVWDLPGGEFRLQFETGGGTMTGYRSFSTELETEDGFTVGDSAAKVRQRYGNELGRPAIGEGGALLSEGEKGTYPAITFAFDEHGEILAIEGGQLQPAGD